ncbi:MAG: hypothetical protein ACMXYC_01580 [Candidatus Woesearchaeota archaeon]
MSHTHLEETTQQLAVALFRENKIEYISIIPAPEIEKSTPNNNRRVLLYRVPHGWGFTYHNQQGKLSNDALGINTLYWRLHNEDNSHIDDSKIRGILSEIYETIQAKVGHNNDTHY